MRKSELFPRVLAGGRTSGQKKLCHRPGAKRVHFAVPFFTINTSQVSVHHYGLQPYLGPSRKGQCTVPDLLNPSLWEEPVSKILSDWKAIQEEECPGAKMVWSESATTGDGGCNSNNNASDAVTSNSFIAGFYWISALSMAAKIGYVNVYRQDLVGFSGMGSFGAGGHLMSGGSSYALAGDPGW